MVEIARPVLSVDVVAFTVRGGRLEVLLVERRDEPFRGALALPGVGVREQELLGDAAMRALGTKTALDDAAASRLHLEQLQTFDGLYRDPRGRTVSVAFLGLCRSGWGGHEVRWVAVGEVDPGRLPFDHGEQIGIAVERLRGKLRYTNIAAWLVEPRFRIDELQAVYEAVLGRPLNRANFRTKLLRIGLIDPIGEVDAGGTGRPAHLYRFSSPTLEIEDRDFL